MNWTILVLILVAIGLALPLWQLQRKATARQAEAPKTLEQPAEPGSEGMNVPAAGEVAPGPDEPVR
ncbi:hypothetical protein BH18ACT5_BH18ACT5_02710 [soil metagenome]